MRFSAFSHQGGQKLNCDSISKITQDGVCAFILSDGGSFCGDIVSSLICNTANSELKQDLRVDSAVLGRCFKKIQDTILEKTNEDEGFKNASASCAILIANKDRAVWGHIGNCRIYRLKRNKIISVTDDHTNAFKKFANKEIEYEDIAKYDDGSVLIGINAQNAIDADISDVKRINENNSFLMCSDGFWKGIDINTIQDFKKKSNGTKAWLGAMLTHIEKNVKNDCDSISAVAINL